MPQRKPKKRVLAVAQPHAMAELRRALSRRTKAELVDVLLDLAQEDRAVLRQLTARYAVAAAPAQLVAATRQAIADATAFDPRDINHNFDYDDDAYREVQRNLGRLITAGQLRLAMQLALELMKQGSYQVEMSDEGLMTEDIEGALSVVLKAVATCDLPAAEIFAWCQTMLENDRVGCIAQKPLESMRNRHRPTAAR